MTWNWLKQLLKWAAPVVDEAVAKKLGNKEK